MRSSEPSEAALLHTPVGLAARFKTAEAPTYSLSFGSGKALVSRLRNFRPLPGISQPQAREEAISVLVPLAPARFSYAAINGRERPFVEIPGQAFLFDLTSTSTADLQTLHDNVRFYFSRRVLDELADDKGLSRIGGILPRCVEDPVLHNLANAIAPMLLRPGELSKAFMEHLILAVHDHLVVSYAGQPAIRRYIRGGLAQWQIRRIQEFVDANLADDPSLVALSAQCGLSTSYFIKAFKASFGTSPHRWIMARRISRAKTLLAMSDQSLTEIALLCGFSDHSHFSQTFRRIEGETPSSWRRKRLG